jgi:CubicO group peptidase (beta-lactamase class C family)
MQRLGIGLILLIALIGPSQFLGQTGADDEKTKALAAGVKDAVEKAIAAKQTPGAVVLITRFDPEDKTKWRFCAAYGQRALIPKREEMTTETIFDMASLTKPIVTATCVMKLIEEGKLRLTDKACSYLAAFAQNGKDAITIEQLLLHTSGLVADNAQEDYEGSVAAAFERIDALTLKAPPGTKFIYSDVGYIVLGRIVEQLTVKPLDQLAREWIFQPLEMNETLFNPPQAFLPRCAPTEKEGDEPCLCGIVHDPRARCLKGIAGHAGLFSTASDVEKYAIMLLQKGTYQGKRVLQPETVALMTKAHQLPGGGLRSYGFDMDTNYSAPRGDRFPIGQSYGHTGFTGTSVWIDPVSRTIVILLTNRVHPDGKGNVTPLRRTIANLAAN